MKTVRWVQYMVTAGSLLTAARGTAQETARPNIVWIFSDDHSYQSIGACGGTFIKIKKYVVKPILIYKHTAMLRIRSVADVAEL